jgi:chemotaxis protein histidine kinase CheA
VDDPIIAQLIEGFAVEARDICRRLTANLLELEHAEALDERVRTTHFEEVARGLHTLKGNADTFGFPSLAELAHAMEDLVGRYRPTQATPPAAAIDLLLRSLDVFVARLAARATADDDGLVELRATLTTAAGTTPRRARSASLAPIATGGPQKPGTAAAPTPKPPTRSAEDASDDWRIGPRSVETLLREVERLRELRLKLDEQKREIENVLHAWDRAVEDPAVTRVHLVALSRSLGANSEDANDIIDGLEQELKAIATLPVYTILDPLQRAVRDLCRTLGKEARLAIVGAENSLDRRVLEALKGPLVHLVRNAVDHGVEMPHVRTAAGKHREGSISIRVGRSGNTATLQIEDDGAGVDATAVRDAAVTRGVISAEEANALTERELHELVFRPGFSTRATVTETSGRGVGLDVVRAAVQALGGHVELHTTRGYGSRIVLTMPAAIGATPVLVVRVDETYVGIPMVAIGTIRAATREHIKISQSSARFQHGEHLLPLIDLGAVLALRAPVLPTEDTPVLILQVEGVRVALAVDELVGDRELVVRPLPAELQDLTAYQGAAVQARGDMLLVVQPEFLVATQAPTTTPQPLESLRRALVVDDSLTARALHRSVLESGGYQVHTVGSARQALDHLRHAHYDVVVADVMMPGIDGVQLTVMLRDRAETRDLPLILVSAHDAQPERERGLAAGADAFVSKKDCISGRLLGEVAQVIARRRSAR